MGGEYLHPGGIGIFQENVLRGVFLWGAFFQGVFPGEDF